MELAHERGLDGISMRTLAQRLGVAPMSIYNHVDDRGELIRLVVDSIGGELDLEPRDESWDARLWRWATEVRRALRYYPGTAQWLLVNPPAGPSAIVILERALAALSDGGFDDRESAEAYALLTTYVLSRCNIDDQRSRAGTVHRGSFIDVLHTVSPADFPHARRVGPTMAAATADEQFDAGLRIILDGLR